jgi:hypothetical protein
MSLRRFSGSRGLWLVVALSALHGCGSEKPSAEGDTLASNEPVTPSAEPAVAGDGDGGSGSAPEPGASPSIPVTGPPSQEPTPTEQEPSVEPMAGAGGESPAPSPAGGGDTGGVSPAGGGAGPTPVDAGGGGSAGALSAGGAGNAAGAAGTPGAAGSLATGEATFTIEAELASELDPNAPTTVGIVTWSVDAAITEASIEFGLDDSYGMTAPVDLEAEAYRTLLLGMKTETPYHFRVVASDGTTTYASEDQTLTTGAAPSFAPITSFSVMKPESMTRGFFVTSFWRNGTTDMPFIFDSDGDLVWWYSVPQGQSGISHARLSADGMSIWCVNETLQGAPLQRVSIDGLEVQTYSNVVASHDITAVSGEKMAFLEYGESDCDSIVEIDNAGNTEEVFESTDVTGTPGSLMSCHGNAVRYSMTEDVYTFSDHRQTVAVVDREGNLVWKLTDLVEGGKAAWGGSQHGHQLLDGSILIYANDGAGQGQSQAIEYGLDGTLIKAFSSAGNATNFGDVQRLANGNTIVTYSTSALIQVVDPNDELVAEVSGSGSFGYLEFRESLYGLPDDIQQ